MCIWWHEGNEHLDTNKLFMTFYHLHVVKQKRPVLSIWTLKWQESIILWHLWGYFTVTVNLDLSYFCYTEKEPPIKEIKRAQNRVKGNEMILSLFLLSYRKKTASLRYLFLLFYDAVIYPLSHYTGSTCRMLFKPRLLLPGAGSTPMVSTGSAFPK